MPGSIENTVPSMSAPLGPILSPGKEIHYKGPDPTGFDVDPNKLQDAKLPKTPADHAALEAAAQ